jgi:hypothetical protein
LERLMAPGRWRAELLTAGAVLLLLVPWLSKPPAIDDDPFFRAARNHGK